MVLIPSGQDAATRQCGFGVDFAERTGAFLKSFRIASGRVANWAYSDAGDTDE